MAQLGIDPSSTPGRGAVRVGNVCCSSSESPHGRACHTVRARRMFGDRPSGEESAMSSAAPRPPKHPPPWFVHTAWRADRALYRLSGGRFLWATSNKRLGCASSHDHRAQVRARAQRHHRLPGRWPEPRLDRDERLDQGHPSWWLNLEAHPDAVVRLTEQDPRPVRARPAAGQERDRLWQRWVAVDPRLDVYASRRSTETPVIVLGLRERDHLTPGEDDRPGQPDDSWCRRTSGCRRTAPLRRDGAEHRAAVHGGQPRPFRARSCLPSSTDD